MCHSNSLHLTWFCRYWTFKFWWRHNDVIITSQNFFEQPNKRTKWQGFICAVAIACILHGSRVIPLLNFDDVIMASSLRHIFFEQPSKRTKWQGFICAVVIACILHGSLVIRLLNFDDVIMTSHNFLIHFRAQFPWASQRPVVALGPIFYGFLTVTPPNLVVPYYYYI